MRDLVIIPTFNERRNLEPLAIAVLALAPSIDLLVVDDNSPDGTGALADHLAQRTGRVHVLHRPGKQGLGTAYLAGFDYALDHDYDRIVEMDADFSHRPEDLPALLKESDTADLVRRLRTRAAPLCHRRDAPGEASRLSSGAAALPNGRMIR